MHEKILQLHLLDDEQLLLQDVAVSGQGHDLYVVVLLWALYWLAGRKFSHRSFS